MIPSYLCNWNLGERKMTKHERALDISESMLKDAELQHSITKCIEHALDEAEGGGVDAELILWVN